MSQEEWILLNKLARDQEQEGDMKRLVNTSDYAGDDNIEEDKKARGIAGW